MRTRMYRLLWLAKVLTKFAEVFYLISIFTISFQLTQSSLYVILISCFIIIGKYLGNSIALIIENQYVAIFQTVKIILLCFLLILDMNHTLTLFPLYLITLFVAFFDGLFLPQLLRPHSLLSNREEMLVSNGFMSYIDALIPIGGWIIGVYLLVSESSEAVLALSAILSFLSLFIFYSIPSHKEDIVLKNPIYLLNWKQMIRGFQLNGLHFILFIEIIGKVVWMSSVLLIFIMNEFNKGIYWWGILNAFFFAGIALAYYVLMKYHSFFKTLQKKMILILSVFIGCSLLFMALNKSIYIACILFLLLGFCHQIKESLLYSNLLRNRKSDLIKFLQRFGAIFTLILVFSIFVVGIIAETIGIQWIYFIFSILSFSLIPLYLFQKN